MQISPRSAELAVTILQISPRSAELSVAIYRLVLALLNCQLLFTD